MDGAESLECRTCAGDVPAAEHRRAARVRHGAPSDNHAMVNVNRYQIVAIGATMPLRANYRQECCSNNLISDDPGLHRILLRLTVGHDRRDTAVVDGGSIYLLRFVWRALSWRMARLVCAALGVGDVRLLPRRLRHGSWIGVPIGCWFRACRITMKRAFRLRITPGSSENAQENKNEKRRQKRFLLRNFLMGATPVSFWVRAARRDYEQFSSIRSPLGNYIGNMFY